MSDLKTTAKQAFSQLRPYLYAGQLSTLEQLCEGEEGEYFRGWWLSWQRESAAFPRWMKAPRSPMILL